MGTREVAPSGSSRSKKARRLLRAERATVVRQMAATLAHEINNPLTSIILTTSRLYREEFLSADIRGQVRSIREAASKIQRVLKKIERLQADRTKEYIPGIQMLDLDEEP